ncbi:uncharacterized protein LOC108102706 [Drosophila eugracilis]|uniref:uncharacterized protein LOC108102706 n=1 Tax=Drosophila eugracilis TaxID=29029 RepID=UPI0007E5F987|nr:uncharacterized protein LOC108102706 [Drosophila eugracilis]
MCFCSTLTLKISLLVAITLAAGFNAGQVSKDITMLDKLEGHHHVILIISLSLCVIILVVLLFAIFAAIRHHILILSVSLICLFIKSFAKMIILIVSLLSVTTTLENTAAHFWFILCWIFTITCMITALFFLMRLKEYETED